MLESHLGFDLVFYSRQTEDPCKQQDDAEKGQMETDMDIVVGDVLVNIVSLRTTNRIRTNSLSWLQQDTLAAHLTWPFDFMGKRECVCTSDRSVPDDLWPVWYCLPAWTTHRRPAHSTTYTFLIIYWNKKLVVTPEIQYIKCHYHYWQAKLNSSSKN